MDRFKELGIDTHGRTSGKMKTKCPWCHAQRTDKRDKSLSVNLDTKLYLCHYCGAHGSAAIYAGKGRKLGDPLVKFPTATGSNSSCPPTEKPHGDPEQGALTQKQIEWCRDVRHIPPEVLVEAGVAFASISMPISGKEKGWEKRDCLCFNFFENGELVNTKFRDSQKHFKLRQGARTIPYNIDAIRDTPECILVEGEFDALSYMAVGRTDVISVPNGANSQLDWLDELSESHFEQKQVIYLSVDTDRKGRELCRELSRRLGVDRCRIVTYGEAYKDANELLVAEGPDALLKALEDAPIPRLEGTFTAEDLREGLHQLFEEGYTSGVELGIPNLDEIMRLETGRVLSDSGENIACKIARELEQHQVTLLKDVAMFDQMYELNLKYYKELTMYILAGKKRLAEVRSTELEALRKKAEQTGLAEDAQAYNDLVNLCNRFEKKLHDLELTRMVSVQMGPQTRLLQNNDTLMIEKIQSSLVNTIPLWKSQMVLSLGLEHSRQATAAQSAVTNMTNQLLQKNAEMLHMGTVEAARESERGIVDLETLQHTNQQLIATLDEVMDIQTQGAQKRREAEVELQRIEGELKQKLLELRG